MDLARNLGYNVIDNVLARYDIYTADEVFLTGTAAELIAVVALDKRKIGQGKPGRVTKELSKAFSSVARSEGTPIK